MPRARWMSVVVIWMPLSWSSILMMRFSGCLGLGAGFLVACQMQQFLAVILEERTAHAHVAGREIVMNAMAGRHISSCACAGFDSHCQRPSWNTAPHCGQTWVPAVCAWPCRCRAVFLDQAIATDRMKVSESGFHFSLLVNDNKNCLVISTLFPRRDAVLPIMPRRQIKQRVALPSVTAMNVQQQASSAPPARLVVAASSNQEHGWLLAARRGVPASRHGWFLPARQCWGLQIPASVHRERGVVDDGVLHCGRVCRGFQFDIDVTLEGASHGCAFGCQRFPDAWMPVAARVW